jgi:hypothetical protein
VDEGKPTLSHAVGITPCRRRDRRRAGVFQEAERTGMTIEGLLFILLGLALGYWATAHFLVSGGKPV